MTAADGATARAAALPAPRTLVDRFANPVGLVRLAFLTPQLDGRRPFVRELELPHSIAPAELVPLGGTITRSFVTDTSVHAHVELPSANLLIEATTRDTRVLVSAETAAAAQQLLDEIHRLVPDVVLRQEVTIRTWHRAPNGPESDERRLESPTWPSIRCNYAQEIHAGEEAGIGQWRAAAMPPLATEKWEVHCPPRLASSFDGLDVTQHDYLDLTISLRSRRADRLHDWVATLLQGSLALAARHAQRVQAESFPIYLTRDLAEAKAYVRSRYEDDVDARYGLLASARTQTFLPKYGVDSSWPATKRVKLARWYNEPAGHPQSCCALEDVVTEFGCQGLELDLPIVCWGNDYLWNGTSWTIRKVRAQYPLDDAEQIRRNAYRVLLTRGRDGLVIFIPPDPTLDLTEHALLAAGVRPLPAALAEVLEA